LLKYHENGTGYKTWFTNFERWSILDSAAILDRSRTSSVAVIGDVCLDQYYFIDEERHEISLETGLETKAVKRFKHELGGAGNVAVNCRRLGVSQVDVFGILGRDSYAGIITDLFGQEQIGIDGLVIQDQGWSTHVYHKVYERHDELPRFDIGNFNTASKESIDHLIDLLQQRLEQYDVVIINEQVLKGIHTDYMQQRLNALIKANPDQIWLTDCRNLHDSYPHTIHKLNNLEAMAIFTAAGNSSQAELADIAHWLLGHWGHPLVITRGADGALVCSTEGVSTIDGLHIIAQIDTVGAGDAFIAGLAAGLSGGGSLVEASNIGNYTAGVSIQILYETGHPTRDEVLSLERDAEFRRRPETARDPRRAVYLDGTEIEIINPEMEHWFSGSYPDIAVFDHDGTISTLRHGWESVMLEMMIHAITGEKYDQLSPDELLGVELQARDLIEKTTGVQTVVQMKELIELVRHNALVPQHEIKSPAAYKADYNEMLMRKVDKRRERFTSGRLGIEDVTIKGSVPFLKRLRESGTTLYLASGTDLEDVRHETEVLGYENLFDGGVHGSVGDVSNDPKRLVLSQIISEIEASGGRSDRCIIFGDGPVEIREAKRHGIPAVGIISDERQRFGMNLEKRERLVLAGADVLIPDFSWADQIANWLGWEVSS
jgi:rfaE bifunctional protein kinase chain/domain